MQIRTLLLALFLSFALQAFSQNQEIDSIRKTIHLDSGPDLESLKSIFRITSAFTRLNADSALKYGELGVAVAQEVNDSSRLFLAYRKLGRIKGVLMRDMKAALEDAQKALALAEDMQDQTKIATASLELAMTWPAISMEEAMSYNEQAIAKLETMEEKTELVYKDLADAYGFLSYLFTHSNLDESILRRKKAAFYAQQAQDSNRLGISYAALGDMYFGKDSDSSLHYFKRATTLFIQQNNLGNLGQLYTRISNIYSSMNLMDSCIYYTQKSLELAEKTGDVRSRNQNYSQLVRLWTKQKQHDDALFYANKWLTSEREITSGELPYALCELGYVYYEMRDLGQAKKYYEEALAEAQKLNSPHYEAMSMSGLARIAFAEKKYEKALSLFQQKAQSSKDQAKPIMQDEYQMGKCLFYLGRFSEAKRTFKALLEQEEIHSNSLEPATYEGLARCDSALGNYASAFQHLNTFNQLQEKQLENKFNEQVAQAQSELKTELKEAQIRDLEQKEAIQSLEIAQTLARSNFFLTLAIILGLAAFTVGYLFIRIRENKRKIESQTAELQALNATKDRLFGIIAHDLRGPVSGFQALGKIFSHHIKKGNTDKLLAISERVEKQSIQLKTLLDNLLQWSLQQLGTYRPQWEQVLIKPLGQEVVAMYEESSAAKENEIEVEIPENLTWKADKNGLRVVLNNLLNNAIKFTEKGKIRLQAQQEANQLQIEISDTGSGMTAEQLAEFRQQGSLASQKGTAGEAGTGLGLNLVYQLIQRWGGELKIQSEVEKGTKVQVYLPVG